MGERKLKCAAERLGGHMMVDVNKGLEYGK